MKAVKIKMFLVFFMIFILAGCSGSSSSGGSSDDGSGDNGDTTETGAEYIVQTRIDDSTGFINFVKLDEVTEITNANGVEINPMTGLCVYNKNIFVSEAYAGDKIIKYSVTDGVIQKSGELATGEGSLPMSIVFADGTKAYAALPGAGKLLIFNPSTMTKTGEIDLTAYAMDADGNLGGDDMNPEPSCGIIRDGKLYMGLMQVDSFNTVMPRGEASVVIIDVATDTVLSHITDSRTSSTGRPVNNLGVMMDENDDIYFNNLAGFGYYGMETGILRIKSGEDIFDPDYYFSISGLQGLAFGDGQAACFMVDYYAGDGKWHVAIQFPSLMSNPPDYVADRVFKFYELDIYALTATDMGLPATNGWTAGIVPYNGQILFGLSTLEGDGLYRYDPSTGAVDQTPWIRTEGLPVTVIEY